jgi:hypothetical protein
MNILNCCVWSLIYIQDNGLKNSFLTKQTIVSSNAGYQVLDSCLATKQHPYYNLIMG